MPRLVLVVDDDPVQRRLAGAALEKAGHEIVFAENGKAALALVELSGRGRDIAAMVLDLSMPDIDGLEVLTRMRRLGVDMPVVVQTARGSIDMAVQAMRAGAFDFVVKPAAPERLQAAIANAIRVEEHRLQAKKQVRADGSSNRQPAPPAPAFGDLITASPAMGRLLELARKGAASSIPILIEGESGVGKEVVARAIQQMGEYRNQPFVTVNCGAIPHNLVESILFGHEKGSFTGATERHIGKFVEADGGTLFLDEVGDLPLDVQVKLLRAVQQGEIDPVGSRTTVKVNIRLISATNRDLAQLVKEGRFREDLYYRLNVFPLYVPPLRERRGDIAMLVRHFIATMASSQGERGVTGISAEALAMLCAYDWPGNIRQLENAVFRAVVLAENDVLTCAEFPQIRAQLEDRDFGTIELHEECRHGAGASSMVSSVARHDGVEEAGFLSTLDASGEVRALAEMEAEIIRLAIERYNGQMSEVARRLGIGRSTLYRKLKEMGLDPERQRVEKQAC